LLSEWFQGYGGKAQHPMYKTTSATYGAKKPSVHTMPTSFHCRSQKFSEVYITSKKNPILIVIN